MAFVGNDKFTRNRGVESLDVLMRLLSPPFNGDYIDPSKLVWPELSPSDPVVTSYGQFHLGDQRQNVIPLKGGWNRVSVLVSGIVNDCWPYQNVSVEERIIGESQPFFTPIRGKAFDTYQELLIRGSPQQGVTLLDLPSNNIEYLGSGEIPPRIILNTPGPDFDFIKSTSLNVINRMVTFSVHSETETEWDWTGRTGATTAYTGFLSTNYNTTIDGYPVFQRKTNIGQKNVTQINPACPFLFRGQSINLFHQLGSIGTGIFIIPRISVPDTQHRPPIYTSL